MAKRTKEPGMEDRVEYLEWFIYSSIIFLSMGAILGSLTQIKKTLTNEYFVSVITFTNLILACFMGFFFLIMLYNIYFIGNNVGMNFDRWYNKNLKVLSKIMNICKIIFGTIFKLVIIGIFLFAFYKLYLHNQGLFWAAIIGALSPIVIKFLGKK